MKDRLNKRIVSLLAVCFFILSVQAFAQSNFKELFEGKTKIYFYGLDFSQARFIGTKGFKDPPSLSGYFMPEWNGLFVKEAAKYTLQKALHLKPENYITSVSQLTELNKKIDVPLKITDNAYNLSDDDVKNSVKQYDIQDKDGIGLSYVVESLNKTTEKANVCVTFFDLTTKTVLFTEKIQGDANGGSFRNYWAGAILRINNSIANKYYKKWKAQQK